MSNESDGEKALVAGNSAVNIAMLVHPGIGNTHGQHILHQSLAQQLLLGCGGTGGRAFIGLGVERHIAQETFRNSHILIS